MTKHPTLASACAAFVALALATCLPFDLAVADWSSESGPGWESVHDSDTDITVVTYHDDNGTTRNYVFMHEVLVNSYEVLVIPASGGVNPNWEDNGQGTEPPNFAQKVADAIRQAILNGTAKPTLFPASFWASPMGQYIISQGGGIVPKYQPGGDDNNSIGAKPTKVPKFDDGKMIKGMTQKAGPLTNPGYQPNSGSYADYVQGLVKSGPKGGGGGGDQKSGTGNAHDKDSVKGLGLFSDDMPGPPQLINPNPVNCTSKATGGKNCTVKLTNGRVLAFNVPAHDSSVKEQSQKYEKRNTQTNTKGGRTTNAQTAVICAPNMMPGSGGNCVPRLDNMPGSDSTLGSTPGAGRNAPAVGGGGTPAGRR